MVTTALENMMAILQNVKYRITIRPSNQLASVNAILRDIMQAEV